jgi:RNA polymerase sigma-70 factor (ECF subfamily)
MYYIFISELNQFLLKNQKKTISIDIEVDEEGTTLKDFIKEEESYEHVNNLTSKKSDIMKEHISKLKEPYKKVIEMREIKKMQYKDIAEQLGKNLSTIKSQIRNGRAILISQTQREFDLLDDMYM